jgi:hypothetical protein
VERLEDRTVPSTFTVSNVSDSGPGSLRQAILDANSSPNSGGPDLITFAISGSGPQLIQPQSALPQITDPVILDGTQQPGYAGTPLIQIDGSASNVAVGLDVTAGGSTIAGLDLSGFSFQNLLLEQQGGNVVTGCYIGTDPTGTQGIRGAVGIAITVGSDNNTIGGTSSGCGNLISGQLSISGLSIGSNYNLIEGNFVGTDALGTTALGTVHGIYIYFGTGNTVGGTIAAARNLISGCSGHEVQINSASANVIEGNLIGTDVTGTVALSSPQGSNGVFVNGGIDNTVGGTTAGAGNVISGQTASTVDPTVTGTGVLIGLGSTGTVVQGNLIGTDVTGSHALGNVLGVLVDTSSSDSTIGGGTAGAGNVISGNTSTGIELDGDSNLVSGNLIGTDATGTQALGNPTGVVLANSANNTVGGTTTADRNVISGSGQGGATANVLVIAGTTNLIEGNFIGTDVTGSARPAGSGAGDVNGVLISGGTGNTVGGTAGAGNLISGMVGTGGVAVAIQGNAAHTVVQGNFIGTDVSGTQLIGNRAGIVLAPTVSGTTIGGTTAGAGNVVSGSSTVGIQADGSGTLVQGNKVGTDFAGTLALPNATGMIVAGAVTVGGIAATAGNLISGNTQVGLQLGPPAKGTFVGALVQGNRIGTDGSGTQSVANGVGVLIASASNTVGGTGRAAGNLISGNLLDGLDFSSTAATHNTVVGNLIGTDASGTQALGNGGSGVGILGGSTKNLLGGTTAGSGNVIAFNGQYGIYAASGTGNSFRQNTVFANDWTVGIRLAPGANQNAPAPHLSSATYSATTQTLTIVGSLNGLANASYQLDFFVNPGDDAEGQQFLGSARVQTSALGAASFTVRFHTTVPASYRATAAATDPVGNTSPFSFGVTNLPDPAVFTVTNTNDSGPGSLREAIRLANANSGHPGGPDTIAFNLPGGGVQTIALQQALPPIRDVVHIDGTTQPGYAGQPLVVLDGSAVPLPSGATRVNGLDLVGGKSSVLGLAIGGFSGAGILLEQGGGNVVRSDFLGTDATGTAAQPNQIGIEIVGSGKNTLGGTAAGQGNLVSGNRGAGIHLVGTAATANLIVGNSIGTDVAASQALANGTGVWIESAGNTVGGTAAGTGNLIAGNLLDGIDLAGGSNKVFGNRIGVLGSAVTGYTALGNGGDGVNATGNGNRIGNATGGSNAIGYNGDDGVGVSGTGNSIRANRIFSNTNLGISLAPGGNKNRVAPQLLSAVYNATTGRLTIKGKLKSIAGALFTLEFYSNQGTDAEGGQLLGSATFVTNASGSVSFTVTLKAAVTTGQLITATATDPSANTSAFSTAVSVS